MGERRTGALRVVPPLLEERPEVQQQASSAEPRTGVSGGRRSARELGDRTRDGKRANLAVVLLAAALLVLLLAGLMYRDQAACGSNSHGLAWTFSPQGGCRYEVNGTYVPAGKLRFMPDGHILMEMDTVSA